MTYRHDESGEYEQEFDVENRLVAVTDVQIGVTTEFRYDAAGQRVKTERPGRVIYTPFPGYEEEIGTLPAVVLTADEEETLVLALGDSFSLAWNSSLAESCSAGGSWSGSKTPQGSQVMTPAGSGIYTYDLVCSNEYGESETASVTVDVGERPSVTITVDGLTHLAVPVNQSFTLAWQSSGAVGQCSADGSWSGSQNQNGSQTLSHAGSGSYSYELTCSNTYGTTSATATVSVYGVPALEMSIIGQAQPPYIVSVNQPYTVNWSGVMVQHCQASGAWSGSKSYKGSQQESQAVVGSYTYTLTCEEEFPASEPPPTLTAQVTVEVVPLPSLAFTVNGQSSIYIDPGHSFTLAWDSRNTTKCIASTSITSDEVGTDWAWQGNKPLGGSEVLAMDIPGSHEFVLTCFNAAGTPVSQTVTVVVEKEGCVCLPGDGSGLMGGNPPGEKQIERLTLSLAGQPVAVLVSGDVSERNGIYYFMGDHPSTALGTGLGSSNVLVDKSDNSIVPGSRTFYQPFGGYRGDLPDQGLSDQGFTGHKHNNDLGLIYMNARYYLPYINQRLHSR
ncbi:MAG: hypothetical protein R6X32_08030 [Chloroflexota bacterium]